MSYTKEDIEELFISVDESLIPENVHTSSDPNIHSVYAYSTGKIITDGFIGKTGDSDNESERFKGVNAAVLAEAEGTIELNNTIVRTSAVGGDAIVSYEYGEITLDDVIVYTEKERSAALVASEGATISVTNLSSLTKEVNSPGTLLLNGSIEVYDSNMYTEKSPVVEADGKYTLVVNNSTISGNTTTPEILLKNGDIDTHNFVNINNSILSGNGSSIIRSEDTVLGSKDEVNINNTTIQNNNPEGFFISSNNGTMQVNIMNSQMDDRINLASITGNSHVSIYTNSNIRGNLYTYDNSELTVNLINKSVFTGSANGEGILVKLSNSYWELTEDAYINELDIDYTSIINKNGHSLFISGEDYTEGITIGSVVHYTTNKDKPYERVVLEKNCIVIKKIVLEDNTNEFILYDADDHLSYRAKKTEIRDTGKTVDITPILDQIESLLIGIDIYNSNTTVINKEENINTIYIDAEDYTLDQMVVYKYNNAADETRGSLGQNAAIKVTNTSGNEETPGRLTLTNSTVTTDGYYASGLYVDNDSEANFSHVNINVDGEKSSAVDVTDATISIDNGTLYSEDYIPLLIHDRTTVNLDSIQFSNNNEESSLKIQGTNNTLIDSDSNYTGSNSNHIVDIVMEAEDTNNDLTFDNSVFETIGEHSDDIFRVVGESTFNEATLHLNDVSLNNFAKSGIPFYYINQATVNIIAKDVEFTYHNDSSEEPHIFIDENSIVNYKVIYSEPEPDNTEVVGEDIESEYPWHKLKKLGGYHYVADSSVYNLELHYTRFIGHFDNMSTEEDNTNLNINITLRDHSTLRVFGEDMYIHSLVIDDTSKVELEEGYRLFVNGREYTSEEEINDDYQEEPNIPYGRILKVIYSKDYRELTEFDPNYIYFLYDKLKIYIGTSDYIDPFCIVEKIPNNLNIIAPNVLYITTSGKVYIYTDSSLREVAHVEENDPNQLDILAAAGTTYFYNAEKRYIDPQTRTLILPYQNGSYQLSLTLPEDLIIDENTFIFFNPTTNQWEIRGDSLVDPYTIPDLDKLKPTETNSVITDIVNGNLLRADVRISPREDNLILEMSNGLYVGTRQFVSQAQYTQMYNAFQQYKRFIDNYILELKAAVENIVGVVSLETINSKIATTLQEYEPTIEDMKTSYDEMYNRLMELEGLVGPTADEKILDMKNQIIEYIEYMFKAWNRVDPDAEAPEYTDEQYEEQAAAISFAREKLIEIVAATEDYTFALVKSLPSTGELKVIYAIYDLENYRYKLYEYKPGDIGFVEYDPPYTESYVPPETEP